MTNTHPALVVHVLKCNIFFLTDVAHGRKTFEVRKHDRDFQVGNVLELFDDHGSRTSKRVSYILTHEDFPDGIKEGYAVLGLVAV